MKGTVQKWGNSLALRIPSAMAKEIALGEGSSVEINAESGKLVVKPSKKKAKIDIDALIAKINPKDRPKDDPWGAAMGRESW